jgi:5'-methylthioadenosine phosphorylase
LEKSKIAIIGGTGFEDLVKNTKQMHLRTPYGAVPSFFTKELAGKDVLILPRHGPNHSVPPHKVNYRANIYALHKRGAERILATNAVGAINKDLEPGDIIIPSDFVDFTKFRPSTFFDKAPVTHIDVSEAYCPEIRKLLIENARRHGFNTQDKAVLVCTEGPRFETPAEIELFRQLGCEIVGMTGFPEVALARELQMCYASVCYVSNMAAGIQKRLAASEVSRISKQILPKIKEVLIDTIRSLPDERGENCTCARALQNTRFE